MKSILISGYFGVGNFGDDLNLTTINQKLSKLNHLNNIYYSSAGIQTYANIDFSPIIIFNRKHKNKLINFFLNVFSLFKIMKRTKILIFGGGTQYFESGKHSWISFLLKYISIIIVKINNGKIIQLAVGIGKVDSRLNLFLLKQIFSKSNLIFLRDQRSFKIIKSLLPKKPDIILNKDISYYHTLNCSPIDSNKHKLKVGLNLIDYYNYIEINPEKRNTFKNETRKFIEYLIKNEYQVTLFSLQRKSGGKDYEFNREIVGTYLPEIEIKFVDYDNNITEFINNLASMDFCVGMRYHFNLLSLQNYIPCLGINYQPKVKAEFSKYQFNKYTIEMVDYTSNDLAAKFSDITTNRNFIIDSIKKQNKEAKNENDSMWIKSIELISNEFIS